MHEVEVWVLIDETGDYGIGKDAESMAENYENDIGAGDHIAKRQVKVTLMLPAPKPVEVTASLPEEQSDAVVTVK